jgi:hypothetical protein
VISLAHLVVLRAEAGALTRDDVDAVPRAQFRIWFSDLSPHCPDRRELPVERRPANALNVEIGSPQPRCMRRSPDGRGAAWMMSGGSMLAYGCCSERACPRAARGGAP